MNLTKTGARPPDETRSRKQFVIDAFDRYERQLTAYALRFFGGRDGNLHAARDVVQFTFMKLCQQRPESIADKLAPWLYTVCRNRIVDEIKASQKRPQLSEQRATQIGSTSPDPAMQLEIDDFLERLPQLFGGLSESEREVIELWSQGLQPIEIAEVIEKSAGNVRVTLHRGIKKLQRHPEVSHWLERATGQHETCRSALNGSKLNTASTTGKINE
ncbi:RNA polymerase sigma factor [Mariniblastus fucicola]|uniref:ECF RNA polymerase sigma factor SigL n=1 Tax=Mariniblastus fucicola TaxID=980251 RepID=A0A5B9PBJ3_9BACT|nr:sigma-70 family RNA polymerase sigma factor [Mariniblastus fucicola]QEG20511.1 ECF RNA polymerase sigma factor SigL [Mariniblastus fucicola]